MPVESYLRWWKGILRAAQNQNYMFAEQPARAVSQADIQRVQKHVVDLREELRRCLNRADANRNGGHLLDNIVRESLRLSQSLRKAETRLQNLKARRAEDLRPVDMPVSTQMVLPTPAPVVECV
jgi:hypothetical protein